MNNQLKKERQVELFAFGTYFFLKNVFGAQPSLRMFWVVP